MDRVEFDTLIPAEDLADMLWSTYNYAFGRRSYFVGTAISLLERYIRHIPKVKRQTLIARLEESIENTEWDEMQFRDDWEDCLANLKLQLEDYNGL